MFSPSGKEPAKIDEFRFVSMEGGYYCYFTLKDSEGNYTVCEGTGKFVISADQKKDSEELYRRSFFINRDGFTAKIIGTGVFKRSAYIYPLFQISRKELGNFRGEAQVLLEINAGRKTYTKKISAVI